MKKILLFASAVTILFSSCSTDSTQDVIGNEAKMGTISANAAYQQEGTRTYLDQAGDVVWSKGDALGVFGESGIQTQFGLVSGEGTVSGKFAGNTNYLKATKPVYAYYPYDRNAAISGSKVTLSIAEKQTYLPADNATFDAAQAPAFAYIKKLEDKESIVFNFKGAASYLSFPVKGNGLLESLSLNIGDQSLAGTQQIDLSVEDNSTTANVDETPAIDNVSGAKTIVVNCGGIELHPENPVFVTFVVPVGVDLSKKITLTAKFADHADVVSKDRTITVAAGATAPETTRNNGLNIWADSNRNAWTFAPKGYYIVDDVAKFGLDANESAALDFITYAYFAQADQPSAYVGVTLPDSYNGPSQADWNQLYKMDAEAHYLKALICAEEIDFENFDAQSVFHKLGVYTTEKPEYDLITVYKNALTWYIENGDAIEPMAWGESGLVVMGYDAENPAVINGLVVKGNGISAPHTHTTITTGLGDVITYATGDAKGMGLKNLEFTNSAVALTETDEYDYVGFIAPKSGSAVIENVTIGAGNIIDATTADYKTYLGGIFGWFNTSDKIGVEVEEIPAIVLNNTPSSTWSLREPSSVEATAQAGQLFGDVYVTNHWVVDLADYNFVSLADMPIAYHVQGIDRKVIDITADEAIGAAIDNVFAVNGTTDTGIVKASIVLNGVSYWTGEYEAPDADAYYTAEELAYVLATDATASVVLTHNIDMLCNEDQIVTLNSGAVRKDVNSVVVNKVQKQFEIKNLIGKTTGQFATLFGATSDIKNVKLTNVEINTGVAAYGVSGLAINGVAENVVVDGLAINVKKGHFNKAGSIGGVFAEATDKSIKNVTVNSCAIDYKGDNADEINVGIVAGMLKVAPDAAVTLEGIKLSTVKDNYSIKGFAKTSWWATSADIKNFVDTKAWAGRYPFGIVNVTNAAFPVNGNTKAYLKVADFQSWSTRLAAGVVFADALTDAADANVLFDAAKVDEYKYAFILKDATIGNNADTVFGFNKAE